MAYLSCETAFCVKSRVSTSSFNPDGKSLSPEDLHVTVVGEEHLHLRGHPAASTVSMADIRKIVDVKVSHVTAANLRSEISNLTCMVHGASMADWKWYDDVTLN